MRESFTRLIALAAVMVAFGVGHASAQAIMVKKDEAAAVRPNSFAAERAGDDIRFTNLSGTFTVSAFTLKQLQAALPEFPARADDAPDALFLVVVVPSPNRERAEALRREGAGLTMLGSSALSDRMRVGIEDGVLHVRTDPGLLEPGMQTFTVDAGNARPLMGSLMPGDRIACVVFRVARK